MRTHIIILYFNIIIMFIKLASLYSVPLSAYFSFAFISQIFFCHTLVRACIRFGRFISSFCFVLIYIIFFLLVVTNNKRTYTTHYNNNNVLKTLYIYVPICIVQVRFLGMQNYIYICNIYLYNMIRASAQWVKKRN